MTLGAVLRLSLRLGVFGFGGGLAVIGQARRALVEDKRWLEADDFTDLFAVAQALPGPVAANFFTLLGRRAGGFWGALLTTVVFLLPSVLLMAGFAAGYGHLQGIATFERVMRGMNPAVVAIVVDAGWRLAQRTRRPWEIALGLSAATIAALRLVGVIDLVLLAVAGGLALGFVRTRGRAPVAPPPAASFLPVGALGLAALPPLAWVFLRMGLSLFGGGLAMIPLLQHELVERLGWLTPRELADAILLGQLTPGPIANISTFVGWRLAGPLGALVATVALFVGPFALSVAAARSLHALRGSPWLQSVLEVMRPVVIGTVIAAAWLLGRDAIAGTVDAVLLVAALAALLLRAPAALVMLAAALVRLFV